MRWIGDAWDAPNLLEQSVRILMVAVQVVAHDLNVDRRGETEIENLTHDVGGKKCKGYARELFRQSDPEIMDVLAGDVAAFIARDTIISASEVPTGAESL